MESDHELIVQLEHERCAAISCGDGARLRNLLIESYVHVHMNGAFDDRDGHVKKVLSTPRKTERGELKVMVMGESALIIGHQINHLSQPDGTTRKTEATCLQLAVKHPTGWRIASTQLTPLPPTQGK